MPGQNALALAPEVLENAMRRALAIAGRGPAGNRNPQVGCIILSADGDTVAEGWHEGAGTLHAETAALAKLPASWASRTGELTAVVTLEPCNHTGHTGPCAVALIEAGIGAVAYGLADPGAASSGGADTLRAAGVRVTGGVLEREGRELLASWLAAHAGITGSHARTTHATTQLIQTSRPHITVKWAQTLDGRAAASDGSSQWITGAEARADVHRRRALADAIIVGTGTLIADDPSLTARANDGALLVPAAEQPVPVVIGHRPIPTGARVLAHPALSSNEHTAGTFTEPIALTGDNLLADMERLYGLGIHRVFIEGGPNLASSFIRAGLADELLIYVAPALLGGPMLALGDIGVGSIGDIQRLNISESVKLGDDLLIVAQLATAATSTTNNNIDTTHMTDLQEAR